MRRNVEMTLNANTAKRFRETAERLANMNLGDDGLLAATVLLRIAASYERAATIVSNGDTIPVEQLNATNNE
jgi:hypothetical protein